MKSPTPTCPRCRAQTFVVRERYAERTGSLVGAALGAAILCSKLQHKEVVTELGNIIKSVASLIPRSISLVAVPVPPLALGTLALGIISASAVASTIGQHLDTNFIMRYRCNRCGCILKG